jgi:LysM repeat protein
LANYYLCYETAIAPKTKPLDHLISYVAQENVSLETIAQEYNSSLEAILVTNNFSKLQLTQGEIIAIPVTKKVFRHYTR